jgi:GMP synthase (glutamine-hydrolysing)
VFFIDKILKNGYCLVMLTDTVLILDFGSQFTQLIARQIREKNVFCQIVPYFTPVKEIAQNPNIKAIILSGGPNSVYDKNSPQIDPKIFDLGIPVLGVCYGMQLICSVLGGSVVPSNNREYGQTTLKIDQNCPLFLDIKTQTTSVWMSHGDSVVKLPTNFDIIATTQNCPIAAVADVQKKIYGIQFHPEVVHSKDGSKMIANFLFEVANIAANWVPKNIIDEQIEQIKTTVGDKKVLCGLSGGVDSSVVAALISKAIGKQLYCVFVDNGLLRKGEREQVEKDFAEHFDINLTVVDASKLFLEKLKGVSDPETKRKIIGATFIEVFDNTTSELNQDFAFLAQGTLYPDVIESSDFGGISQTIKSHHNVGGLPKNIKFKLLEPFREMFKDEVRKIGRELGLPSKIVDRHPFPGPGLAIRILGDITQEKLEILKQADDIFISELKNWIEPENGKSLYQNTWQAFAVLTPLQTVGVMGDGRTYQNVLGLRAVTSIDGMTADWAWLPSAFLAKVSNRIVNEVKGINRVVYDITSKPASTIEWE